jgi:dCMP deaminase
LSPFSDCAKLIAQSAIKRVVYEEKYDRDTKGIELLQSLNISCEQLKEE